MIPLLEIKIFLRKKEDVSMNENEQSMRMLMMMRMGMSYAFFTCA